MYHEIFAPVDNSPHSNWAVDCAIEICARSGGRITGNHVYAARLHDVRFRQLESGLPAEHQAPEELDRQRRIHDRLIEKGLQLISDSFLDEVERKCRKRNVSLRRQLLEGSNFEEIITEVNLGGGHLPSMIGLDDADATSYDSGAERRHMELGGSGRKVAQGDSEAVEPRISARDYDLVIMGAHGLGRQEYSQLGGVVARVSRRVVKDLLVVRNDAPLQGGRILVCVDGSAYSYRALRRALELASQFDTRIFVCSSFDVEFHHTVFDSIKGVLSERASRVFKFEEQEELHNAIIDKGLLKLCQANIKRAQAVAAEFPDVELETQVLIGKPFQVILRWAEELDPTLIVVGRHGSHRIAGTELGSQADNILRLTSHNVLITGVVGVSPEDVPRIAQDGEVGLPWVSEAELRIQRVPLFAQGIARRGVEEFVRDAGGHIVTNELLDRAIRKLLPTHMQLIMGLGETAEQTEAERKAEERMAATTVLGNDDDDDPAGGMIEVRCPRTNRALQRERNDSDPRVWTQQAFARLSTVPLIARPTARDTVERFARQRNLWRITTSVMDDNRAAMIAANEFDADTMMSMFHELRASQIRNATEQNETGAAATRSFVEDGPGEARCPIRDIEDKSIECPVDHDAVASRGRQGSGERDDDAR